MDSLASRLAGLKDYRDEFISSKDTEFEILMTVYGMTEVEADVDFTGSLKIIDERIEMLEHEIRLQDVAMNRNGAAKIELAQINDEIKRLRKEVSENKKSLQFSQTDLKITMLYDRLMMCLRRRTYLEKVIKEHPVG